MKKPNGYGSITKLTGNRRKPYMVRVTKSTEYDPKTKDYKVVRVVLGYYRTQAEANKALVEYNDSPFDLNKASITFKQIWDILTPALEKKLSSNRMGCYRTAFNNYCIPLHNMSIREINADMLREVVDECDKGSGTKSDMRTVMNRIFEYAVEKNFVSRNYAEFVSVEKDDVKVVRHLFDLEEISILWEHSSEWEFAIIIILLYTGMRVSELLEVKRELYDPKDNVIRLDHAKNKQSIRTIPIHSKILPIIMRFYNRNCEYLIVNDDGYKVSYTNYMSRNLPNVNEYMKVAHTPYDCRHTFITRAKKCKLDDMCKKLIVGHKQKSITEEVYTHITIEELHTEIEKIQYDTDNIVINEP